MSAIDIGRFLTWKDQVALVVNDQEYTYRRLHEEILLAEQSTIFQADVVQVTPGDFMTVPRLLAVFNNGGIAVLMDEQDAMWDSSKDTIPAHPLVGDLLKRREGGLILRTSGSTGDPKLVLHSMSRLGSKFSAPGKSMATLVFFPMATISGVDTMLYTVLYGGKAIVPVSMSVRDVCIAIQRHGAEVLSTSTTFLSMLLLAGAQKNFDLSSLRIITFGGEPADREMLPHLQKAFPHVKIKQKFGMTEVGALRTVTHPEDPSLIRIESDDVSVRIKDGLLEIKTNTSMLGYLNSDQPFSEDGWMKTGDVVEVVGDWLRVIGRKNPIIKLNKYE